MRPAKRFKAGLRNRAERRPPCFGMLPSDTRPSPFRPIADSIGAANCVLFDHLVDAHKNRVGDREAECFCRFRVKYEFEFGRLHYRQVGGCGATEDSADIDAGLAVYVEAIGPVTDQTDGLRKIAPLINRGNLMASRQCNELVEMAGKEQVGAHYQCANLLLS